MERGGFHGYHHKLPRLSSSSEMNHQGLGGEQMMNGKAVENHHQMINNGTGRMVAHEILNHTNGNGHMAVNNNAGGTDDNECTVREQDRFMPIANVIRIMRKILPPHAKISDDAKETIQECVSEYISFITGEANERCQREQRKTITAEDVLWAMSKLGFDDYVDPLTLYLHRYREVEGDRGALRGDPLVKRAYDYGGSPSVAIPPGYAPMFHMAPHHHHHHHAGYYGPPHQPANAYMKEASNGGGSNGSSGHQSVVPGFEPYGQQNK